MNLPHVVVLAGGSSSRFYPLKHKLTYKFLGKTILEHQIDKLKANGFADISMIINPEIRSLVEGYGVNIIDQKGDGMAGAVKSFFESVDYEGDLLIVNGNDFLEDYAYKNLVDTIPSLREKNENALLGMKMEKYMPFGYLKLNEDKVMEIVEKPGEGNEPSKFAKPVFDYFNSSSELKEYMSKAESESDDVYEVALTQMMTDKNGFMLIEYEGKFNTVKYPWHILGVKDFVYSNLEKSIHQSVQIAENAVIGDGVVIEEGVKIFEGAVIKGNTFIGKNSIVGNNSFIRDSHIGEDCVIGTNSEVARSYFGNKVWLHMNYVGDSVIENNVSFGAGTITSNLRLDEGEIEVDVKGEKVKTGKNKLGIICGSDVRIGTGCLLQPGIKIGPNSIINSGVKVTNEIPKDSFVKSMEDVRKNRLDVKSLVR